MIFESIFMIRGGTFGVDFGSKLVAGLLALGLCLYDWKKNNRLDYIWVYITATLLWGGAELYMQLIGTRVFQEKIFFGIDVSSALLFTAILQGMTEAAMVTTIGLFFGDRILDKKTRKKGSISFLVFLSVIVLLYIPRGINFNSVPAGDLTIPSRRDMFPPIAIIVFAVVCLLVTFWLLKSDNQTRKRGLLMYIIMASFIACWTLMEWLTGDRWIEVGTITNGTYSNLRRAEPLTEFLALAYDYMVEVSLIYVPYLSIPYWLKLIKPEDEKSIDEKLSKI